VHESATNAIDKHASSRVVKTALDLRWQSIIPLAYAPGQTRGLWQNERNVCLHSYTTWKTIYPSFVTRRMLVGDDLFSLKRWVKLTALERKRGFSIYFCS